jgi:serine/threonine protein phosphatase PrpC
MKSTVSSKKNMDVPKVEDVKFIEKPNGVIKGYAVNTFHGMLKSYNEDRVSIIMNITKPNFKGKWPKCSYFGIFDGHGGHICSDFLKDNMHKFVIFSLYRLLKMLFFHIKQSKR